MSDAITSALALHRPPQLRSFDDGQERHATWLELFFDLVFVLAVAELASALKADLSIQGFGRFFALFVPVWWIWMGYTFYADQFDTDDVLFRLTILAAMLGVVALSVNIPGAFTTSTRGWVLSVGALQALLAVMYLRALLAARGVVRALCSRFAVGNFIGCTLWLSSLLVAPPLRYGLWAAALIAKMTTPMIAWRVVGKGPIAHLSHIPERFGLFTIIVLGEAVVAAGQVSGTITWTAGSIVAATSGMVIAGCMWCLYFDVVDGSVIRSGARSYVYGYSHFGIFAGITAFGVGAALVVEHASSPSLGLGERTALCGGVAVYLLAVTGVQLVTVRSLRREVVVARAAALAGVLGVLVVGGSISPPATGTALVVAIGIAVVRQVRLGEAWARPGHRKTSSPIGAG